MRVLLINPNTTGSITALLADQALARLGPDVEVRAVTGRFGARYIASRAAYAIAGHAVLDAFAEHGEGCDAVLLACFGDPALLALRELSPVPVVGMAEASCLAAAAGGRRFGIVTGGERWGPMLREFVGTLGLAGQLAAVRTVAPSGAAISADPEAALAGLAAGCRACLADDGAEVVILGGAGLAGLAPRIRPAVPGPVICSVEACLDAVVAAAAGARTVAPASPGVGSVGLAEPLARRLAQ